ncbi:phosphoribosylanthranilate isomerase [Corallibacter sp.]|uniref:phosphoribosylanthranilate isomerase n=1 Tax=Corallibacter sp. TaxID=2038084 RepID=UPI003AB51514
MKLKICGMKYQDNITKVANLQPDYLGFIFYKNSSRYFEGDIPELPKEIKKVGVFVNAESGYIVSKVKKHGLDVIQLHGSESVDFCNELKQTLLSHSIEIIKVFSIKDQFNFDTLKPYETVCDYFLFDTKGKLPGGNGYVFNWEVLNNYPSTKPYFLSGGIGLDELKNIHAFTKTTASKYCYAIDVNSKFEDKPGLKNLEKLQEFNTQL